MTYLPSPLAESGNASDGIYYIVRWPAGWEIFPYRFRDYGDDPDHTFLWQELVAPMLASMWAAKLKLRKRDLERELTALDKAFPRGRIEQQGLKYEHLHGADSQAVGKSLDAIETVFGVAGQCVRETDDHECCEADERDALIGLLHLTETWPALD